VLTKQLSIAVVSTKIATAVNESLSKQQKALFLCQQLAAINAELPCLALVSLCDDRITIQLQDSATFSGQLNLPQPQVNDNVLNGAPLGPNAGLEEMDNDSYSFLEPANTDLRGSGNITEDEDDLDVVGRVNSLPAGTEVRCIASTEARRLRRIRPQNADHSVVRYYVRTSNFFLYQIRADITFSLNDSPLCLGLHHLLAPAHLRGLTSSPTQSRNLMRTILALIRSRDG